MTVTAPKFAFGHQFKAREARDQLKDVLDEAEKGGVVVVRRGSPVVVALRDDIDELVATVAPLDVKSAVTGGQFAFWLEGAPVHATAADLDAAEEQFLDALIDYADLWYHELRHAPNHAQNRYLALRVAIFAGEREELRRVVFGD
jgi:prevent-host-death family protein